jgi:hypothetical protein
VGGLYLHLYWQLQWLDSIVHILGGVVVSLTFLGIISKYISEKSYYKISYGIVFALIIGIIWEFYELKTGAALPSDIKYPMDTIGDLACDALGGIIGSLYMIWNNKQQS